MSDYRPTQADREAAKAIKQEISLVNHTVEQIAAIIAEKMQPERESAKENWRAEALLRRYGQLKAAADRLVDAVEEIKQIYDTREYGNGWIEAANIQLVELLDALAAYREATK
jgi:predicted RNase H-like nuclease (RuvC/YqgF family)